MSVPLPPRLSAPNSTFGQLSLRDQKPEDYSQTNAGTGCLDESAGARCCANRFVSG